MFEILLKRPSEPELVCWHKILVVDDDPEVLSALRRLLQREPYDVVTASHPELALEWLSRRDVSLTLVDLRMPEMSGDRFLEEVRKRSPRTARAAMTGYPGKPETGGLPVIRKPWDGEKLKRTVRILLSDLERAQVDPPSGGGTA